MPEPSLHVTIVTEQGRQYEGEAVSIVAPGELGLLGILAHHAPLLTTLVPGQLVIRTPESTTVRFRVGGGLLEVFRNHVTLVTDTCAAAPSAA